MQSWGMKTISLCCALTRYQQTMSLCISVIIISMGLTRLVWCGSVKWAKCTRLWHESFAHVIRCHLSGNSWNIGRLSRKLSEFTWVLTYTGEYSSSLLDEKVTASMCRLAYQLELVLCFSVRISAISLNQSTLQVRHLYGRCRFMISSCSWSCDSSLAPFQRYSRG